MNIQAIGQHVVQFWRGKWQEFAKDVRRLDAASRPMTAGIMLLGLLHGCIPLAALIVVFRLTDAVTGARGVRVQTSDLTEATMSVGVVWLVGVVVAIMLHRLHGVAGSTAHRVSDLAFALTLAGCMFIIAPFSMALCVLLFLVMAAYLQQQRVRYVAVALLIATSVSLFTLLQNFLLARAVTVGSFLLFAGATVFIASRGVMKILEYKE